MRCVLDCSLVFRYQLLWQEFLSLGKKALIFRHLCNVVKIYKVFDQPIAVFTVLICVNEVQIVHGPFREQITSAKKSN